MSDENPWVGNCGDCGSSIWAKQARIEDAGGNTYHADCRIQAALKQKYEKILSQAEKALNLAGHNNRCRFTGCTCGATADFKVESGEFYRLLYDFKTKRL